ncbi:HAD hydrolase family protein [Rosettibacter firmus]|uniref:HAD hydrolase family protein n=1 Tax=Rosettibacter firmus TaxID=3111522 RepID=UPI00336C0B9E
MNKEIINKIKEIRLIIFDLEGVLLTQANLDENIISQLVSSIEKAVEDFQKRNINIAIITARPEDELIERLKQISNCTILSSSLDKVTAAEKILAEKKLNCNNVFFIGDGILDIPLIKKCGLSAAPKTAKREVKREVDLIINSNGYNEIFTEIMNLIDMAKN